MAPERELIRRIAPFTPVVMVAAFAVGAFFGGTDAGWSAAIAIAVVSANFVAHASSLSWAAAISPVALAAVGLGGFVIRLAAIVVIIALLNQLAWFSVVAFIAALVPATVVLLFVEMKMLSGRMQADLWSFPNTAGQAPR